MNLSLGMSRGLVRSVLCEPQFSLLSLILGGSQITLGSSGGPGGGKAEAAGPCECRDSRGQDSRGPVTGITDRRASGKGLSSQQEPPTAACGH